MHESENKTAGSFLKDLIKDILIALAIVLIVMTCIKPTIVNGESMENTLFDGHYLIVNKLAYKIGEPERGDIIVLKSHDPDHKLWIKRVIGVSGDEISFGGENCGDLYRNGELVSESYIKEDMVNDPDQEPCTVPEGAVYVMGDNRNHSHDSRDVGCVQDKDIVGKAVLRLYPFDRIGVVD